LLGPHSNVIARPSQMPAIIAEPLFLTNPTDAHALRDSRILEAIAQGLFDGIQAYVASTHRLAAGAAPPASHTQPLQDPPWTVWAVTYADSTSGQRRARLAVEALKARGLPANLLKTTDFASLVSGFVVVTAGPFQTRQAALAGATQVRLAGYQGAYVRRSVR